MILPPYIPQGGKQVLYSGPYWDQDEIEAATKVLTSGSWITSGEYVVRFQNLFSKHFGVKHSLMVNSGSSANLVMIAALKKVYRWNDGDEVIVSPVGFPTTIAPLVQNGLRPVFADIETNTLNFDLREVESRVCSKTVAIFVSPVLGNPPDMDEIKSIAAFNGLTVIGDNCDSLGSKWSGQYLTSRYEAWSSSFYPAHHICTGEGGMVSSNDQSVVDIARSIAWWGRDCYCVGKANLLPCGSCKTRFSKWLEDVDAVVDHKYVFTNLGYNLKPLDLQGAIGIEQMKKIEEIERRRRWSFEQIKNLLEPFDMLRVATVLPQADPCWFGVPIICRTQAVKESLVAHFESNGIQTRSYFAGNILLHPAYRHLDSFLRYPNANLALTHVFFLGASPHYDESTIDRISEVLKIWQMH